MIDNIDIACHYCLSNPEPLRISAPYCLALYGTIWHHSMPIYQRPNGKLRSSSDLAKTLQRLYMVSTQLGQLHGTVMTLYLFSILFLLFPLFPMYPEAVSARLRKALDAFDTMKPCPGFNMFQRDPGLQH